MYFALLTRFTRCKNVRTFYGKLLFKKILLYGNYKLFATLHSSSDNSFPFHDIMPFLQVPLLVDSHPFLFLPTKVWNVLGLTKICLCDFSDNLENCVDKGLGNSHRLSGQIWSCCPVSNQNTLLSLSRESHHEKISLHSDTEGPISL